MAKEICTGAPPVFDFWAGVISTHLLPEILCPCKGESRKTQLTHGWKKMELAQPKMARICGHKEKNKMYIYTTNVGSEGFSVQPFL